MKKTPLAKLIKQLESFRDDQEDSLSSDHTKRVIGHTIRWATALLAEERENLTNAYSDGRLSMLKSSGLIKVEQYFTETFEQ